MKDTSSNPMTLRWPVAAAFMAVHIFIFTAGFSIGFYSDYSFNAFGIHYIYADNILNGQLPYLDFAVEYPPLGLVFMVIPRLFAESLAGYTTLFIGEMLLFDLAALLVLGVFSARLKIPPWKTLAVFTLLLLAVGPIITVRYDMVAAFLSLGAVYAFARGRYTLAWVALGLGVMTKLYPLILAPLFLIWHFRSGQRRQIFQGGAVFAVTVLASAVIPLLIDPGGFVESFAYHADRPLQIESLYASFILAADSLGWVTAAQGSSFGSINLISPEADFFASASMWFMAAGLGAIYLAWDRLAMKEALNRELAPGYALAAFSAAAVTVFLVFNKVLSPQFIIWLFPLIPLMWRTGPVPVAMFVVVGFMTAYIYPLHYDDLRLGDGAARWVLLGRNVLLLGMAPLLLRCVGREKACTDFTRY